MNVFQLPLRVGLAVLLAFSLCAGAGAAQTDPSPGRSPARDLPVKRAAPPAPAAYAPGVAYSSYFGASNGQTIVKDIKVNATGEVYLAGYTSATNLPTTAGTGQNFRGGGYDGFIAKFASDMRTLVYLQYVGSAQSDEIYALALDAAGNAYLAGYTYPSPNDWEQPRGDAVIYKAVFSGYSVALYGSTIGGPNSGPEAFGDDRANDLAIAPDGTIWLAGRTTSLAFPGAAGTLAGASDGFLVRYDANLYRLSSRYLNQSHDDGINALDIGSDGWITVAGWSRSGPSAVRHVWASRLNPTATASAWSQIYQGNGSEEAFAVRVNGAQQAWLTGVTSSSNFAAGIVIDDSFVGPDDGFAMRLQPTYGNADYRTYLGGIGSQRGRSIDIAANGDVIVAGATQPDVYNPASTQAFLLRLNAPSYLGMDYTVQYGDPAAVDLFYETLWERRDEIAMTWAPNRSIYLAGMTSGSQFSPITANAYQPIEPAPWQRDGFYMRIDNSAD